MIRAIPVPAESVRYATPVLFLAGLWCGSDTWGGVPSAMAHRGWDGALVEFPGGPVAGGGLAVRAEALAAHIRALGQPPALIGHDAGALLGLAVARRVPVAGLVLLAPLRAGAWPLRVLVRRWDALAALLRGRPVPPPDVRLLARVLGVPPPAVPASGCPEPGELVLDVVRGRGALEAPPVGTPALLLSGAVDPHLAPREAEMLAGRLGAEHRVVPATGHWLPLEASWTATVATMHRWLVQTLGADLLDLLPDAMAERGDDAD